jgi:superfamily II DNA or RNA helicase
MTSLKPRPYQRDAIEAVEAAWDRGVRRPVVVAATGLGKTVVVSHLLSRYAKRTGKRALVLAHRAELIDQAARKIRDVDSDLRVGTVIADADETDADIVVGSVQTLRMKRRRARLGDDIGLIVTDEVHHCTAASYRAIYDDYPEALMLGVTATPKRADGAGLDAVFDEIVYSADILFGIKHGFLADIRGISVEVADLDLSAVRTRGGDFADGDLGEAMEMSMAPEIVTAAYHEHAAGRSSILFAPTVAVAELMAHHLNESGVVTEVVTGATPKDERRAMLKRFEAGTTKILSNVGVLVEGTDLPIASCAIMCRPTKSQGLFIQMAGRVLRPYPGKDFALLLDVAGATAVNNLCSISTLAGRKVKDGESLTEAEEREQDELAAASSTAKPIHHGPVGFHEVDLFERSRWRWRKTAGGIDYIATGDAYVFVMPGEGGEGHDVAWIAAKGKLVDGTWAGTVREGISEFGTAMEWAEQWAADVDPMGTIGEKDRAWHKRRASDKQVAFAQRLGIRVHDGARMLEVSDAIDHVVASRAIDTRILPWLHATGRIATPEPTAPAAQPVAV